MAHASERLTAEDAVFLYFEQEHLPLHIGSVSTFDGAIAFDELVEYVASRLPLIPRYRQRLVTPPLNVGHPTWEADPDFDVRNHVFHERLKRGTERELRELAGRVFSQMMDRTRPLWDLTLVDGLRGGRCGLIARVHHCLVDGVSGAGLMNVMLNAGQDSATPTGHKEFAARPLPGPETSLVDALASAWTETVERVLAAQSAALNVAQALISDRAAHGFSQLARLGPELLTPVEPLSFNRQLAGPRKVAWSEISIAEVKAIRQAWGGTLNDVVLTVLTLALRRYAALHRLRLKGRLVRIMVPVSLRRPEEGQGYGNRVSLLPVSLPLDIANPRRLLRTVREQTEELKNTHVAELIGLAASWMGTTPAPIQAMLGPMAAMLPMPPFNLVCTNVPGPQFPLYALGRRMLTYYPYVPTGSEMGVNCAIQSYDGMLYIGLTGDVAAAPDLDRLKKFLDQAFADLRKQSGVKLTRPSATPFPVSTSAAAD